MDRNTRPAISWPVFFCLLLACMLLTAGCAATTGAGRVGLSPAGKGAEGYSNSGGAWVYRDRGLVVTVRGYTADPDAHGVEGNLYARGYVLLGMSLKNQSGKRVIYNPAGTSLRDDTMGYAKPLDFTDLYDMATEEERLGGLKGFAKKFYDLSVTVMPGQETERLLAFRPPDPKARSATLVVQGVYVGTDVLDMGFSFDISKVPAP